MLFTDLSSTHLWVCRSTITELRSLLQEQSDSDDLCSKALPHPDDSIPVAMPPVLKDAVSTTTFIQHHVNATDEDTSSLVAMVCFE
jgi:hypothetical protein